MRLYLPKEWARDRARRNKAGVPKELRYRTRRQLCLEMPVVIRYRDRDDRRVVQTDYYLSNGTPETELAEFVRAAKAEHRIEECN